MLTETMQFTLKEIVVLLIATAIGFLGIRADDVWILFPCLLVSLSGFLYICITHLGSKLVRAVIGVLITAIFIALGWRWDVKRLEDERRDASSHLRFRAELGSQSDLRSTLVTVSNGGSNPINYRFVCRIKMLVANRGTTVIKNSLFIDHERFGLLDSGSDAQADNRLSDISAQVVALDCADIQVRLFYSLADQPVILEEKSHGFIAQRRGDKFEWADRGSQQEVSDCERFVTTKFTSLDDRLGEQARAITLQGQRLATAVGLNPEKKAGAVLAVEIIEFGESIKNSKPPEPDMERDGFKVVGEYQQKFMDWGEKNANFFHARFDLRIRRTTDAVQKMGISPANATISCHMISRQYPPTTSQTERCGIAIWQLAMNIPDR